MSCLLDRFVRAQMAYFQSINGAGEALHFLQDEQRLGVEAGASQVRRSRWNRRGRSPLWRLPVHLDPAPRIISCQGGRRSKYLDRLQWQVTNHCHSPATSCEPKIWGSFKASLFFRYAHDKEALDEGISYYPASRAIPLSYFPYLVNMMREPNLLRTLSYTAGPHPPTQFNFFLTQGERSQGGYHSPLVAIQVKPKTPGHLVFIYVVQRAICNVLMLIFNLYSFKWVVPI